MAGPLSGLRVLELPAIGPVPFLGMLLADLGAEVIRVDRLAGSAGMAEALAVSPLGRGRRSIALDLRRPDGAEVALRIAATSDVLVEGFRPGVAERLGLGPEAVLARNPGIVYGRMTGWGQDGPLSATAGHDITYLAVSGLLHGIGPAAGPPVPPANYVADFGGGAMFLATGVLAALVHARATGEGQVVDAAMTEGASYLGSLTRTLVAGGGWRDEREANLLDGGAPHYRCYATADDKWVAVGAIEPQFWSEVLRGLGLDESRTPSPYDPTQWSACAAALTAAFRTRTRDEWDAVFAGRDACVAPVLTLAEAGRHPHNVARHSFVDVAGVPMPAPAPRFSRTPGSVGGVAPIGAATAQLLAELGYDGPEIARLRESGAIPA